MDYLGRGPASADEASAPPPRSQRIYGAVGVTVMVLTLVLTRNWVIAWIVSLGIMIPLVIPPLIKDRARRADPPETGAGDDRTQ